MKIKRVLTNNKKKSFVIETSKKVYEFPYAWLTFKPSANNQIISVSPEAEIGNQGFTYTLANGKCDTVLLDQVLYMNRDSEILREHLLFELSSKAQEMIKKSGISKRALARQLEMKPAQLYRLIDQTFYGKTVDQMIKVLVALGIDVELVMKKVA